MAREKFNRLPARNLKESLAHRTSNIILPGEALTILHHMVKPYLVRYVLRNNHPFAASS